MSERVSRKDFVAIVGTAATAEVLQHSGPAEAATPVRHAAPPAKAPGTVPEAYTFFTAPESAFVEAAVERLIPSDTLGREGGKPASPSSSISS